MSAIRFHHVFFALMLLALISAFALLPRHSGAVQPRVESLFAPVAAPFRTIGQMVERRMAAPRPVDPRGAEAIRNENEALRIANASLQAQLDDLKILNADRASLGEVRKQSKPYKVISIDSTGREAFSIAGSTLEGLADDQPVIYTGGIAGRTLRAGLSGTSIVLITDRASRGLTVSFGRFQANADGSIEFVRLTGSAPVLAQGVGNNTLIANTMTLKDVDAVGIRVGDWAVLSDAAWPANLQGYRVGQVTAKEPRPDSPLFAQIKIEPSTKLRLLGDVNVVVK